MNIEEILQRCERLNFAPCANDLALIRGGVSKGQQLVLAVWPMAWHVKLERMNRDYLLMACAGVDDVAFLQAVEDRQEEWLLGWHFLRPEPPPPVEVYHLTAAGGVVSSQVLARAMPSAASKDGIARSYSAVSSRGLGRAVLRRRTDTRPGWDVAETKVR